MKAIMGKAVKRIATILKRKEIKIAFNLLIATIFLILALAIGIAVYFIIADMIYN
ncbi:hypothetical protein [Ornithinibacillus sp. 179-J 7C1 HS]|uniref:hypothetical protein n=1 Tax=Ornithinibacillus sp. 179-J 7C1 HS TaxID=3142384 RepID=UPI00399F569E